MGSRKIIANAELLEILTTFREKWNNDPAGLLHLFVNDFDPTPASVPGDFVEATYEDYAAISMLGSLSTPAKVEEGHYESVTSLLSFPEPGSGPAIEIFGAYVTRNASMLAASRFASPRTVEPGGGVFPLRVKLSTKSESLFVFS